MKKVLVTLLIGSILVMSMGSSTVANETFAKNSNVQSSSVVEPKGPVLVSTLVAIVVSVAGGLTYDILKDNNVTIIDNWLVNHFKDNGRWFWVDEEEWLKTVKINDNKFNVTDSSNWVGDGRTNKFVRVVDLQVALRETNNDPKAIDGYWGPNTKSALLQYQLVAGLDRDGVAGPNTWRALGGKK